MKRLAARLLFFVSAAMFGSTAQAAVGPEALLSSQDQWYQEQALQNALEYNQIGQATVWNNPSTGHRGKVLPVLTYTNWAGQNCRNFRKEFAINGRQAQGSGSRCRDGNGVWAMPPVPPTAYDYPPPYYYEPYGYYYPRYYYRPYPYYYPFSFSFSYIWSGHRHHGHHGHRRRWRRR